MKRRRISFTQLFQNDTLPDTAGTHEENQFPRRSFLRGHEGMIAYSPPPLSPPHTVDARDIPTFLNEITQSGYGEGDARSPLSAPRPEHFLHIPSPPGTEMPQCG